MTTTITLHLPGNPVAKGRPRATKTGGVFTPAATRKAEDTIVGRAMAQVEAFAADVRASLPFTGPLAVTVVFAMPVPSSWSQRKRIAALGGSLSHTSKPDLDNLFKLVADALNGIAWVDDSQIVQVTTRKTYSSHPGITVVVEDLVGAVTVGGVQVAA